jgi:Cys-rich protein (TIGR01571 family)
MPQTIRVVAPATLEESFTFDVLLDDRPFTVTVPPGGVQQGEEFDIPYPDNDEDDDDELSRDQDNPDDYDDDNVKKVDDDGMTLPIQSASADDDDEQEDALGAPLGHWRFPVCACCDVVTQATFWMVFCCTPVAVAQLLTRLRLNWRGLEDHPRETSLSFNKIVLSFVAVLVFGNVPAVGLFIILFYCVTVMVWIGGAVRKNMRQRYRIPDRMGGAEDCVCMSFCGCCSLIQMARHTHDDKEYPGFCCTTTGLELEAPKIV